MGYVEVELCIIVYPKFGDVGQTSIECIMMLMKKGGNCGIENVGQERVLNRANE